MQLPEVSFALGVAFGILVGVLTVWRRLSERHRHKWGRWARMMHADVYRGSDLVGRDYFQQRECQTCGKTEIAQQRVSASAS